MFVDAATTVRAKFCHGDLAANGHTSRVPKTREAPAVFVAAAVSACAETTEVVDDTVEYGDRLTRTTDQAGSTASFRTGVGNSGTFRLSGCSGAGRGFGIVLYQPNFGEPTYFPYEEGHKIEAFVRTHIRDDRNQLRTESQFLSLEVYFAEDGGTAYRGSVERDLKKAFSKTRPPSRLVVDFTCDTLGDALREIRIEDGSGHGGRLRVFHIYLEGDAFVVRRFA